MSPHSADIEAPILRSMGSYPTLRGANFLVTPLSVLDLSPYSVPWFLAGAGSTPCFFRMFATVLKLTSWPTFARAPEIPP